MKTMQFKTNIKCDACIANATPQLDETVGQENWEVNISLPEKILTVTTDDIDAGKIEEAVNKAGYKAERI